MPDANIIEAQKPQSVRLQSQPLVLPFGAAIESAKLNERFAGTLEDLMILARQGNINASAILNYARVLQKETDTARQTGLVQKEQLDFMHRVLTKQSLRTGIWYDLHETANVFFLDGSDISKRASVSGQYGQATIPMNAVQSKTYSIRLLAEDGISQLEVLSSATGVFDKQLGDGVTNYEGGSETPTIEETPQSNATNGNNLEFWRRRIIFPLESDVSEVEVELTITLPSQSDLKANVLYVHPYPLGNVDVVGMWVSPDLTDSFTQLTGWSDVEGATKTRWYMPAQNVSKVKVRLRQRNWFEDNGRKVFEYGLQELGVQLVEWDRHYDSDGQLADNHSFVTKIQAPTGTVFHKLHGFYTDPNYLLEAAGSRHLHFVVSTDPNGAVQLWNSDRSAAPQSLETALDLGLSTELYVVTTLNWAETVGVGSPFQALTPPWLSGFGMDVRLKESS